MRCDATSMIWLKFGRSSSCGRKQDFIGSLENWNLSYLPCSVNSSGDVHSDNIYFNKCIFLVCFTSIIFLISWDTELNANLIFVKQLIQNGQSYAQKVLGNLQK